MTDDRETVSDKNVVDSGCGDQIVLGGDDEELHKTQINITVEVSSKTIDRQTLQRALYKAGSGMSATMCDYLRSELSPELGTYGVDFSVSIERLIWN
jgi:hypothetical protein